MVVPLPAFERATYQQDLNKNRYQEHVRSFIRVLIRSGRSNLCRQVAQWCVYCILASLSIVAYAK